MRLIVGNKVYRQAADPQRDREYRDQARDLIAKLKASMPEALHYEWHDTKIFGEPITYATVWFDVGEVDPAYDDLIIDFLPMWRGEGYAQGVYKHKEYVVWGGKDNITVYGLPYMNGKEARTKEEAVDGVEDAFRYYQSTIVHELIHYLDQKRYRDGKKPKTYDSKKEEGKYVSSPHEFNAFYQSWALFMEDKFQNQVLDEAEVGSLKALDRFYLYFGKSPDRPGVSETERGVLKSLSPKMRRRFIKRAAQLWLDLKEVATGGRDIPNPAEHITTEQQLQKWLRAVENEIQQSYHEEWNEWLDDEYMLKDLVTIISDPAGFLDLAQGYSTLGSDWVVAKLPARFKQDYLDAMEKLRQELLARYKVPVSKAASVYRQAENSYVEAEIFAGDQHIGWLVAKSEKLLRNEAKRIYEWSKEDFARWDPDEPFGPLRFQSSPVREEALEGLVDELAGWQYRDRNDRRYLDQALAELEEKGVWQA